MPASRSSCGSTPRTCTADAHQAREPGQSGRWQSPVSRRDDRPRQVHRRDARLPRRARHRRRHLRACIQHRQRPAHEHRGRMAVRPRSAARRTRTGKVPFACPVLVRWPGQIEAGTVSNEIVQHHDWFPTFLAMAGEPDIVEKLKKGHKARSDLQDSPRRLQSAALPHRQGRRARARFHLLHRRRRRAAACASTTGRWCSWSSAASGTLRSGRSRSRSCGATHLQPADGPYEHADQNVEFVLGMVR